MSVINCIERSCAMAFFQNPTTKHENITNRDLMRLKSVGQKMATHQQIMVVFHNWWQQGFFWMEFVLCRTIVIRISRVPAFS